MALTEEQKDIVRSIGKPLFVLAGPGTGKTEVLARRIIYLLKKKLARRGKIVGITFTTKAAKQMQHRLGELKLQADQQPLICTLHSLSMSILKKKGDLIGIPKGFQIADNYAASLILSDAVQDVNPTSKMSWGKINKIGVRILLLKAKGQKPKSLRKGRFKMIYEKYQELLRFHSALDFQDLILEAYLLLKRDKDTRRYYQAKCEHLLVDEFQDINHAEYDLIKLLAGEGNGLFVVGDNYQSIYSWRGGTPEIILGLTNDYKRALKKEMTRCFRCPEKIIKGADAFIRRHKPLNPQQTDSEPIRVLLFRSDVQEADWIGKWIKRKIEGEQYGPEDIAILYRGNDIADKIAEKIKQIGIPTVRPSSKATRQISEFIAHLRLIENRRDSLALRICLSSKSARRIGPKAIKKLRDFAQRKNIALWDVLAHAQRYKSFKFWYKPLSEFLELINSLSDAASRIALTDLLSDVAKVLNYENESRILEIIKRSKGLPKGSSLSSFVREIRGIRGEKTAGLRESGEEKEAAISFITMHSVKGLQRSAIFIVAAEKGILPDSRSDLDEEKRVFYVAITRAEKEVYLCHATKREGKAAMKCGGNAAKGFAFCKSSPFIYQIPRRYRECLDLRN